MKLLCVVAGDGKSTMHILPSGLGSFREHYWPSLSSVTEVDACGYDTGAGWNPARCGNALPCARHDELRCWCGAPPAAACSYAGSLAVCGAPLCVKHEGHCARHA